MSRGSAGIPLPGRVGPSRAFSYSVRVLPPLVEYGSRPGVASVSSDIRCPNLCETARAVERERCRKLRELRERSFELLDNLRRENARRRERVGIVE